MNENRSPIPSRLYNAAKGGHVAGTADIIDDNKGKTQDVINKETDSALENRYTKNETYSKTELNNLITTPEQKYVTLTAQSGDTLEDIFNGIARAANTIYRVGSWDGNQYNTTKYAEYGWTGTNFVPLDVKEYGIDDTPIVGSDNLVKSGGVADKIYELDGYVIGIPERTINVVNDTAWSDTILETPIKKGEIVTSFGAPTYNGYMTFKKNTPDGSGAAYYEVTKSKLPWTAPQDITVGRLSIGGTATIHIKEVVAKIYNKEEVDDIISNNANTLKTRIDENKQEIGKVVSFNGTVDATEHSVWINENTPCKDGILIVNVISTTHQASVAIVRGEETKYITLATGLNIFENVDTFGVYINYGTGVCTINVEAYTNVKALGIRNKMILNEIEPIVEKSAKVLNENLIVSFKQNLSDAITTGAYIRLYDNLSSPLSKGLYRARLIDNDSILKEDATMLVDARFISREGSFQTLSTKVSCFEDFLFKSLDDVYTFRFSIAPTQFVKGVGNLTYEIAKESTLENVISEVEHPINKDERIINYGKLDTALTEIRDKAVSRKNDVVLNCPAVNNAFVINVDSQVELDDVNVNIQNAIAQGKTDIVVRISGELSYKENCININGSYPNVNLVIAGNNTILKGDSTTYLASEAVEQKGNHYKVPLKETFSIFDAYLADGKQYDNYNIEKWYRMVTIASDVSDNIMKFEIEPNLYDDLTEEECNDVYVMTSRSWEAIIHKVVKISTEDGKKYIYFNASDVGNPTWAIGDVNYEVNKLGRANPMYKVINYPNVKRGVLYAQGGYLYIPYGISKLEVLKSQTFFKASGAIKSINIQGIHFKSNAYKTSKLALIHAINLTTECLKVHNCKFEGIKSTCVKSYNCNNIMIDNNLFDYCYYHNINIDTSSNNIVVTNNKFVHSGLMFAQSFCISCYGKGLYIANNEIKDYVYGGITSAPINSKNNAENANTISDGIIENNIIYYTNEWRRDFMQHTLMDGGPIYIGAQAKDLLIRYNVIFNVINKVQCEAIYLDWGTHDTTVYGNVMLGMTQSKAVFSQPWTPTYSNPDIGKRIVVMHNLTDGVIKVYGNGSEEILSSTKGRNWILYHKKHPSVECSWMNKEDDYFIPCIKQDEDKVYVDVDIRSKFLNNANIPEVVRLALLNAW